MLQLSPTPGTNFPISSFQFFSMIFSLTFCLLVQPLKNVFQDPISKFSVLFFRFSIQWFYLAIQPPNSWFWNNGHFRMLVWPQIDLEHLRFWIRCCVNRPKIWVSDVLLAEEQLWILEPKIHPTLYQVWNIHDMQLSCERWAKWTKPAHVWKEQFESLLPKRI